MVWLQADSPAIKIHARSACIESESIPCLVAALLTSMFRAGMTITSVTLLVYTAIIVPVQLCIWSYEDPCSIFPTLHFDIAVDAFFLVFVQALPCPIVLLPAGNLR